MSYLLKNTQVNMLNEYSVISSRKCRIFFGLSGRFEFRIIELTKKICIIQNLGQFLVLNLTSNRYSTNIMSPNS